MIKARHRSLSCLLAGVFFFQAACPRAFAADLASLLPLPGDMTGLSASFAPASLKGVRLLEGHGGLRLEFVLDKGDEASSGADASENIRRLVSYFLTALTLPGEDMWVNLSPYEGDRTVPARFGMTEMGRDLLAQDYLLKQLAASLFYPEGGLGKRFWDRVYREARERFGVSDVPVDTFNKVWIVPGKATVYENGMTGFILKRHLKVMLESDYVALSHQRARAESSAPVEGVAMVASASPASGGLKDNVKDIIREIILPAIEKEVNEGRQFAPLRQVYDAQILAVWFKTALRSSVRGKSYADRQKISGVDVNDPSVNDGIYRRYVQAFRQGVFNYVKEERDPVTREFLPRKYFSGGAVSWKKEHTEVTADLMSDGVILPDRAEVVTVALDVLGGPAHGRSPQVSLFREAWIFSEYALSALGHGGPLDLDGFMVSVEGVFILLELMHRADRVPSWRQEVMDFLGRIRDLEARMKGHAAAGYPVSMTEWRRQRAELSDLLVSAQDLLKKIVTFFEMADATLDMGLPLDVEVEKAERFLNFYIPVMRIFASLTEGAVTDFPAIDVKDVIAEFLRSSAFLVKRPDQTISRLHEGDLVVESRGSGSYMAKVDPGVLCFLLERMLENALNLAKLRITLVREDGYLRIIIKNQGSVPPHLLRIDPRTESPFVFFPKSFFGPDHYEHDEFRRDELSSMELWRRLNDKGVTSTVKVIDEESAVAALNEVLETNLVKALYLENKTYSKDAPEYADKLSQLARVLDLFIKNVAQYTDVLRAKDLLLACLEDGWTGIDKMQLRRANRWLLQGLYPSLNPQIASRKSFYAGGTSLPPLFGYIRKAGGMLSLANGEDGVVVTTITLPVADPAAEMAREAARPGALEVSPGGIDLNEKKLDLDVLREGGSSGSGVGPMAALEVEGFVPVIVQVAPLRDVAGYLRFPLSNTFK